MACTTGSMLARCMARDKSIRSYPDIGGAAFGTGGRCVFAHMCARMRFCGCVRVCAWVLAFGGIVGACVRAKEAARGLLNELQMQHV